MLFNPTSLPSLISQGSSIQYAKTNTRFIGRGLNQPKGRRRVSTLTGEDESGHIVAHPNEGILFFDSETPILKI